MSATKLVPLDFSMSYEKLTSTCVEKVAFLTRDKAVLAERGITPTMITNLDADRVTFAAIPTNATEVATSTKGFSDRDVQTAKLRVAVRIVINIAKTTFATDSPEYKSFNIKGMARFDANKLSNACPNIITQGTKYMSAMADKGLTVAMVTNITTQAALLAPLMSATPTLVGNAAATTEIRRNAANALYNPMMDMCATAHAYFLAEGDSLTAEDYVVYDTTNKVVDRDGTVKYAHQTSRKTDGVEATTKLRLKVSEGTALQFYYGMTKTSVPGPMAQTVAYNPNNFTEFFAEEIGYNKATGMIVFIIKNPNAADGVFLAKIG